MRMRIATTTAVAAVGLLAAVVPSAATAGMAPPVASVRTDVPCLPTRSSGETFTANGAGFTPGATLTFTLNGQVLGQQTADTDGTFHVPIKLRALAKGIGEAREVLTVSDGVNRARAPSFGITRFEANYFGLTSTRPGLARAKFEIFGFAGAGKTVYLHYIQPNGGVRETVRLGKLGGPCGFLRTAQRKLFPFGNISNGYWRLRFDTSSAYLRVAPRPSIVRKIKIFTIRL